MIRYIDSLLDRITMYRLLLYYLIALVAVAAALGFFQLLYSPAAIALSAAYLVVVCWVSNWLFGQVYEVPTNFESPLITALILALIITPVASPHDLLFLTAAGGLAMASKYILNWRGAHIFNPAAVAVFLTAVGAGQSASWWVGSVWLLPAVVIGGLLVARKLRRFQMIVSFLAVALGTGAIYSLLGGGSPIQTTGAMVLHSALVFLAFVMLTEPLTSPTRLGPQCWYGAVVGLIFPPQVHLGTYYSTPELALLVGNLFTLVFAPKLRLLLRLDRSHKLAPDVRDFVFQPPRALQYLPGQYMELTLQHSGSDARGERRYFTLASSPTEPELRFGIKFYDPGSSFKRALLEADERLPIAAGQLGGDFVLPSDRSRKLAFLAGGIGITPFRSMLKYLIDTNDRRSVTLLYSERTAEELVYLDVLRAAWKQLGVKIICRLTDPGTPTPSGTQAGFITAETITTEIPDYHERLFYISGPHSMVTAMTDILLELGVSRRQIKTDFFPGYV